MVINLDLKDQKILYEIDKNARIPASQIAKKVMLSKVAINNRIKRLVKKGIIRNFITQIDYRKLGYTAYHIYYKVQNISMEKEKELLAHLMSNKFIVYVARIDGAFDIFTVIFTQTNEDLDNILLEINQRFGEFIKERNILGVLNALYFGRRYFVTTIKNEFTGPIIREKPEKIYKLDEVDSKLISLLAVNARISVTKIMGKLNLKEDVIRYRLKKLIQGGIIQKFTMDLNHEEYGNSFFKLLIKFNYDSDEKIFVSRISSYPNLIRAIRVLGTWDLELDFEIADNKDFRKVLMNLRKELGNYIADYNLFYIYKIDKLVYYPI